MQYCNTGRRASGDRDCFQTQGGKKIEQQNQDATSKRQLLDEIKSYSQQLRVIAEGLRWHAEIGRREAEDLRCTVERFQNAEYQQQTNEQLRTAYEKLGQAIKDTRQASHILVRAAADTLELAKAQPPTSA